MINQKPEAKVPSMKSGKGTPKVGQDTSKEMGMDGHAFSEKNNGSLNYWSVQDKFVEEDTKKLNRNFYSDSRYI